ncbi:MAG: hypothetical protein LBF97_05330, partial [Elusimicrobiota bacterium]|nr:hypothetical protein [Elusimicrobiota bacterium]
PYTNNKYYTQYELVYYNSNLYLAKNDFTSSNTFSSNDWYRSGDYYSREEINTLFGSYPTRADIGEFINDVDIETSENAVTLQIGKKNISDGGTSSADVIIPLASNTTSGAMPAQSFAQIAINTSNISALSGKIVRYIGDFSEVEDLDNITQEEIQEIYETVSGKMGNPDTDNIVLVDIINNKEYVWYLSDTTWRISSSVIPIFNNISPGIIKGSESEGKVFAESNGEGSVVGFDALKANANSRVKDATDYVSEFEVKKDDYNDFQEEKNILNVNIKQDEENADVEGFAINGKRIDFDYKNLIIKNASEQGTYPLENNYTITTAYGSVEVYGKLFIFDEEVLGKGIIRDQATNTVIEVDDLGIFAPSSSINVIHVIDPDDKDVCYVINEKTQSGTLVIYPDGTYKSVDFGSLSRTPQNISDMRLLTSVNGNRHSWLMYNIHTMQTAAHVDPTEYLLFQLEDCSFKVLDATTPECSGYPSAGVFTPSKNYGARNFMWEGHTDIDDPEFADRRDTIDTSYVDSVNGNRRLPYKTGAWTSESGSVLKNRRIRALHNGIYRFDKGMILMDTNYTTTGRWIIATPEGFLGWFRLNTSAYEYYIDWREIEIQSGPYAGKRGLFFYDISQNNYMTFIVNTYDDRPENTVVINLKTNLNNLNHLSGLNPIAAAFNLYPSQPYVDGTRIYAGYQNNTGSNVYFSYLNQSEIQSNGYNIVNNQYVFVDNKFDWHILHTIKDTGYSSSTFRTLGFSNMIRMDFLPDYNDEDTYQIDAAIGSKFKSIKVFDDSSVTASAGVLVYFNYKDTDNNLISSSITLKALSSSVSFEINGNEWKVSNDGSTYEEDFTFDSGLGITGNWSLDNMQIEFDQELYWDTASTINNVTNASTRFKINLSTILENNGKHSGTLVMASGYNTSLFLPDAKDTWNGVSGIRPYFIKHWNNEANATERYSDVSMSWARTITMHVIWHNQLFYGATGSVANGLRNYYLNPYTGRVDVRNATYASGYLYCPYVVDDKYLLLVAGENTTRCVGLTWKNNANSWEKPWIETDGGDFTLPRVLKGSVAYLEKVNIESYEMGERNELYLFDPRVERTQYLRFTYTEIDNVGIPSWTLHDMPSMTVGHVLASQQPGRIILLGGSTATNKVVRLTLKGNSITTTISDSCIFQNIVDITNTNNSNESTFGAYACIVNGAGASTFLYILEWDYNDNNVVMTKFTKTAGFTGRVYSLPTVNNRTRFAIGCNSIVASTASNPFVVIERVGGKYDDVNGPNKATNYTKVYDFGRAAGNTARVDLATSAYIWGEPHLLPNGTTVRFMGQKTLLLGDAYSQIKDCALLGYKLDQNNNFIPVYGERVRLRDTGSNYFPEIAQTDIQCIEIGANVLQDSMISFGTSYGVAYKIAEGWEAHAEDTIFAATNDKKTVFKGGPYATVWVNENTSNNYPLRDISRITIENEIVSSNITGHVASQRTHEWGSSFTGSTSNWITDFYGYAAFNFIIRKHRILITHMSSVRLSNYSVYDSALVIDPNYNLPYSAFADNGYTELKGNPVGPKLEITARTPLFQYWDNQILPGIFYRRNNQDINSLPSVQNIVPYFQFTDEIFDMIFADFNGNAYSDNSKPMFFRDEYKINPRRVEYATGNEDIFISRNWYDDTKTIIGKFYFNDAGVAKYSDIKINRPDEAILRISFLNDNMEFTGNTKHYRYNCLDGTLMEVNEVPDVSAVIAFNVNDKLYTFRSNDKNDLYVYQTNQLALFYQNGQYYVIPLHDLNLSGNTVIDNVLVKNQVRAKKIKATTIEADNIVTSPQFINTWFM